MLMPSFTATCSSTGAKTALCVTDSKQATTPGIALTGLALAMVTLVLPATTTAQVISTAWEELSAGARCDYDSDASNVEAFGRLYNWYAVSETAGLCPSGWHVPTDDEWTALETYVSANGHIGAEATALKATSGWNNGGNGTDDFGLSFGPGGYRYSDGDFYDQGNFGSFWSSSADGSNAWFRDFIATNQTISRDSDIPQLGLSVRCLRDAEFQDCVSPTMDEYNYGVVAVGDQCWFAENLRTKIYADGTPIPTFQDGNFPQPPVFFPANPDLGPDVTGIRLRPMSSSDGPSDFAFDAFDLARDEHHVALRLNGTGMAGGELVRADGSAPIVTVVPAGLDIPHSAISDTSILPITGSPTQVEMGSATGAAISFLIINGQPPLPESLVDLLTPVDNGLPEWTGFTTFDDDPTQWQEWAAVVEDPILMADMLGDAAAATYTATIAQVVGTAWEELSVGARCDYDSDASNVEAFGRLYNWYAVSETGGTLSQWLACSD